jgi:hypothetical protein
MPYSIFAAAENRSVCRILYSLTALALIAVGSPSAASEWSYGCRGVLPSGDAPIIIFNRSSLVMLSKAWVKGPLLASVNDELAPSPGPMKVPNDQLCKMLGIANVTFKQNERDCRLCAANLTRDKKCCVLLSLQPCSVP